MELKIENASFAYKKNSPLFSGLSLTVNEGSVLAVLGPNGSGKTTFLRCLMGMLPWKEGHEYLNGEDTSRMSPGRFWRKVSFVPQQRNAAAGCKVSESILLGRSGLVPMLRQPSGEDMRAVDRVMEMLGITALKDRDCSSLSGGELQLVLIARALVSDPELVLLDEPESGLDFRNQLMIMEVIRRLAENGIACIFNTHYPAHALQTADRALLMGSGQHLSGNTEDVLTEEAIRSFFRVEARIVRIREGDREYSDILPLYNL